MPSKRDRMGEFKRELWGELWECLDGLEFAPGTAMRDVADRLDLEDGDILVIVDEVSKEIDRKATGR